MPFITLTTEWSINDYYVGAVKGAILNRVKDVNIIDISHQIQKYNIAQAAFTIKSCYRSFPKRTIHLVAVKSEATAENPYVAFLNEEQYFVGTDNGIFGLIFENKPEKIVTIATEGKKKLKEIRDSCFPELSVLAPAACHLANGGELEQLGEESGTLFRLVPLLPVIEDATIFGSVVYIDSYQNVVTNITRELFEQVRKNRSFEIIPQNYVYKINKINTAYNQTSEGELLAIFNSLGLLEIAIRNGNAAELMNLDTRSKIRIKFHDNQNR